jgi:hypothetical protein
MVDLCKLVRQVPEIKHLSAPGCTDIAPESVNVLGLLPGLGGKPARHVRRLPASRSAGRQAAGKPPLWPSALRKKEDPRLASSSFGIKRPAFKTTIIAESRATFSPQHRSQPLGQKLSSP